MTADMSPSHLSIGEVLDQLHDEFPDITISKIRFLESQGLIDPERTPSGYRKFYEPDVARLRWILYQQKEHFLPLKVIKERLEHLDADELADPTAAYESSAEESPTGNGSAPRPNGAGGGGAVTATEEPAEAPEPEPAPEPAPESPARPVTPAPAPEPEPRTAASGGLSLTREELARAAGLDDAQVAELESFGLLTPQTRSGDQVLYDEEGLTVARTAAEFYLHGFEARHLRMYKHFAEREAGLFEQVLMAYVRQRNPQARAKAQRELAELSKLGRDLRAALLVTALRGSLTE